MRLDYSIIFVILIIVLMACSMIAKKSKRTYGPIVAFVEAAIIPSVIGNLIIVGTDNELLATIGYYLYFLGLDLVMFAILRYTFTYCSLKWPNRAVKWLVYWFWIIDVIQYCFNPILKQAFETEAIMVDGREYFRLVAHVGQFYHRIVDYGVLFVILLLFIVKMLRTPRIYAEKYWIMIIMLGICAIWETYYIFSRMPIDRAMIGFACFGLMVFFFSLYYRPMRVLDSMLASVASELPQAIFFYDDTGKCIWANEPGVELTGVNNRNFEKATEILVERFNKSDVFKAVDIKEPEWSTSCEYTEDGEDKFYVIEKHTVNNRNGKNVGSFISVRDNTEEQLALQRERYAATHDSLTELYTKDYLFERIQKEINAHPDTKYVIVYADISDFKIVNDIFGNEFGDLVLKYISQKIKTELPESCISGRLVADTFGMFMPAEDFDSVAVEKELSRFVVSDETVEHIILMHLGIYEISEPEIEVSSMFDRARMALSTIKEDYQTLVAYYDAEMREKALWEQHIATQLHMALAEKQIRPYLQPIVDTNGRTVGAEALVRWIHPKDGYMTPSKFIPVIEKNGMIVDVDRFMWRSACEILARWKRERKNLFISINISPKDFYFMDVAAELKSLVREYDIDPQKLRIEITETVMMTDNEKRFAILNELREEGFIVEMDDFGSGYSSLNLLKDMPVDVIKIDMSFLRRTTDDERAAKVLLNIIKMTYDLGITSLTEGVETSNQYQMLSDMGCSLFQGFYFSKPMPLTEFETRFIAK